MANDELTKKTDGELLEEAKKLHSFSVTNALFIGVLAGIVFYSAIQNTYGMLTLIPLYFIYRLATNPKNKRRAEVKRLLKERGLE